MEKNPRCVANWRATLGLQFGYNRSECILGVAWKGGTGGLESYIYSRVLNDESSLILPELEDMVSCQWKQGLT